MLENFKAVSPQLAVQGLGFMAWLSLSSTCSIRIAYAQGQEHFWESVREAIAIASAAGDDFNAQLGSVGSPVLGIHDKEVENKNGVQTYLEGCNLASSPTTFPTGSTWTSSHGTEHRDYACFSRKLHGAVSITYTLKDQVLLARNGVDHECVVARLHCVFYC